MQVKIFNIWTLNTHIHAHEYTHKHTHTYLWKCHYFTYGQLTLPKVENQNHIYIVPPLTEFTKTTTKKKKMVKMFETLRK